MKLYSKILLIALTAMMLGASESQSQIVLYGASKGFGGSGVGPSSLYKLNTATGEATLIGPIGFDNVTGMAILGNGRLVASANGDALFGDGTAIYIEIDPKTGAGKLLGIIDQNGGGQAKAIRTGIIPNEIIGPGGDCGRMPDLTYDPVNDILYGYSDQCNNVEGLWIINKLNGFGTPVGPSGFTDGGNGLAIDPNTGRLFAKPNDANGLVELDPETGAGTIISGTAGNLPSSINAMDFNPVTGQLFGSLNAGSLSYLVTIDTATGLADTLGESIAGLDAIVFGFESDIDVSPLSFDVTVPAGGQLQRTLDISNVGDGVLYYQLLIEPVQSETQAFQKSLQSKTISGKTAIQKPSKEKIVQKNLLRTGRPWGNKQQVLNKSISTGKKNTVAHRAQQVSEGSLLPIVIEDPIGDAPSYTDINFVRGGLGTGTVDIVIEFASPFDPNYTGGYMSLDIDQNPFTGVPPSFGLPGQDIGAEYEVEFFSLGQGIVDLYDTFEYTYINSYPAVITETSIAFSLPLADVGNDDGVMNISGVFGTEGPEEWFPDEGHGILNGVAWLIPDPLSGAVQVDSIGHVTLNFSAVGLNGGDFNANLLVKSNDKDSIDAVKIIPIHMTVLPPNISVIVDPIRQNVAPNDSASRTFTISNTGEGSLEWSVNIQSGEHSPDSYGYNWISSDEEGGPLFDWRDVSATGTRIDTLLNDIDDGFAGPFPIGFSFNFYGVIYDSFYVSSNGFIGFKGPDSTDGFDSYSNLLPSTNIPNNILPWFWSDLYRSSTATIFYKSDGNELVIQFNNYSECCTETPQINAEVIIYANGRITYQYLNFINGIDQSIGTVGLENADGTVGLVVQNGYTGGGEVARTLLAKAAADTFALHDSMAVAFYYQPAFVKADITSGIILPGQNQVVTLKFKSDTLALGSHFADMTIKSSDPDQPEIIIPIEMSVQTDVAGADVNISFFQDNVLTQYLNVVYVADEKLRSVPTAKVTKPNASVENLTVTTTDESKHVYNTSFKLAAAGNYTFEMTTEDTSYNASTINRTLAAVLAKAGQSAVLKSPDDKLTLTVAANAFKDDVYLTILHNSGMQVKSSMTPLSESYTVGPVAWKPGTAASVSFAYHEWPDMNPAHVAIYRIDKNGLTYVPTIINTADKTAHATIGEFGKYQVFYNESIQNGADVSIPKEFSLYPNFPNPFNPTTTIRYDLAENSKIQLTIYNILGQQIRTLVNQALPAGRYQAVWDGRNDAGSQVSSGIYIFRLKTEKFVKANKMLLIK